MNPAGPVVPYRPALFLGLGGTGKEVLLRLRRRFYERFRTYDLPFARFLWIDTDMRAVDARGEALKGEYSSVLFQDHERFPLMTTSVGQDLHDIFENPGRWKNIHEWLYESVSQYGRGVKDGAGGVRAIGRLTFLRITRILRWRSPDAFRSSQVRKPYRRLRLFSQNIFYQTSTPKVE